jgi:predicted secreted protein
LDSSVNGKIISLQRNEQIILKLKVHSDGGYQWDCKLSNSTIVKKDSTRITSNNIGGNMVGGISEETFYFSSANTPGECNVTLTEHRNWEKDTPPINSVQFHLLVK